MLGSGASPAGYHATNILLHIANVCLVFALALRLLRSQWPAFFAAAVWAVHPVGVEAVANVAGRADLLAACGMLGALLVYVATPRRYWAIFPLALLAAFSKETGAMLPGLMLLCDLTPGLRKEPSWRARVPAYAVVLAAVAIYAGMRFRVMDGLPAVVRGYPDNPLRGVGFLAARWPAVKMWGIDLGLMIFPAKLASDRAFAEILPASFADPATWASLVVMASILGAAMIRRRTAPEWFWAAGFFGQTLLPASNLVILINATIAERFLYLPAIGFAVGLSALAHRLKPRSAAVGLGIVAVLFAGRTMARNRDWDNEVSLMARDTQAAPRSFRVHDVYGQFSYAADPSKLDLAISELEKSWEILSPLPPERSVVQIPGALGTYYMLKGDRFPPGSPEALEWRRKAVAVLERADEIARVSEKIFDDAQAAAGKPLAPRRQTQMVYALLGNAYASVGNHGEALKAYRYGRGIEPTWPELYDRTAAAHRASGDPPGAARLLLLKAFALGLTPPLLEAVGAAYAELPGGSCAIARSGGVPLLNPQCQPVRDDLCRVFPELAATFTEARKPDRARFFLQAASQYECTQAR